MDSLGRMRASEEEEIHSEGPGSGSSFKVFGRSATEAGFDEAAPSKTVATESTHSDADDPFAALSNDENDSLAASLESPAVSTPSRPPIVELTPHSTRASHEVLDADFPFAAPRPRASRASETSRAGESNSVIESSGSIESRQTTPTRPAQVASAPSPSAAPASATPAQPAAPPASPAALPPAQEPTRLVPTPATTSTPATTHTDSSRPDWYRDPAFWVHVVPLAGTVLILTGFGLVPGLLIENTAGRRDDFVRDQAREAINFQLNYLLLNLIALITFTAPVVWPLSFCFGIVLPIQAALDVKNGKRHRYSLVPRWLDEN